MIYFRLLSTTLVIWVLGLSVAVYEPTSPDLILELTRDNFTEALNANHLLLVDFHAPWCGYCQSLQTELTQVALDLPNMNIDGRVAMIDASSSINKELSKTEKVDGYPSLVLYRDGKAQGHYHGGRTRLEILDYLKKKVGPPASPVNTVEELAQHVGRMLESSNIEFAINPLQANTAAPEINVEGQLATVLMLCLSPDHPEARSRDTDRLLGLNSSTFNTYQLLSHSYDHLTALYSDSLDLVDHFQVRENSLLIFTDSVEPTAIVPLRTLVPGLDRSTEAGLAQGDVRADEGRLMTSILSHSLPTFIPYTVHTQPFIRTLPVKKHVLIFHDFNERSQRVIDSLQSVAQSFRGRLVFVTVPALEHHLFQSFAITKNNVPEIVLADMTDPSNMRRFTFQDYWNTNHAKHSTQDSPAAQLGKQDEDDDSSQAYLSKEDPITEVTVRDFLDRFMDGQLMRNFFSEPDSGAGPAGAEAASSGGGTVGSPEVGTIVGRSFEREVMLEERSVFLYVFASWCGHCKSFEPVLQDLAKLFAEDPDLKFCRLDGSRNEIDHSRVTVRGFPALFLFPAGEKGDPIEYDGERTVLAIAAFLKQFKGGTQATEAVEQTQHLE